MQTHTLILRNWRGGLFPLTGVSSGTELHMKHFPNPGQNDRVMKKVAPAGGEGRTTAYLTGSAMRDRGAPAAAEELRDMFAQM